MSLPSTGQISLSNIQSVMGGVNPIFLSNYYQNSTTGFTSGIVGIPNINAPILFSTFYGKSKIIIPYPPQAVQSDQVIFGIPQIFGLTNNYWVTGMNITNLTTTTGSIISNKGIYDTANGPNFINNQNLIIQGKPGDMLRFSIQALGIGGTQTINILVNYTSGTSGWIGIGNAPSIPRTASGNFGFVVYHTIPSNRLAGNYGLILTTNSGDNSSGIFYSLHVAI